MSRQQSGGVNGSQLDGQQQQQPPARQAADASAASAADSGGGGSGGGGGARGGGIAGSGGGGGGGSGALAVGGGRVGGGAGGGMINANHLLNFQYESARLAGGRGGGRGGNRPGSARGGGIGGGGSSGGPASARRYGGYSAKPQKYDKNKFLQANFRFLVSDAVDVCGYEADADKMFDWEDVLQVEMASSVPVQCPISLDSPPLCPQITPCGHIFSFPAIMHHLINHGGEQLKRSAPCPLCFAPVVARELRLVRVRTARTPKAGEQLTLTLIRRTRTSIIPQAVDPVAAAAAAEAEAAAGSGGGGGSDNGPFSSGGGVAAAATSLFDRNPFAKFVVGGDASELWRAAAEQLAACAMQLVAEGGSDAAHEAPFVYGALDALAARARRWAEHRGECLAGRGLLVAREGAAVPEALGAAAEAAVKKMFTAAVSDVHSAREMAVQQSALDQAFPSLAVAAPPRPPPAATAPIAAAAAGPPRGWGAGGAAGAGAGAGGSPSAGARRSASGSSGSGGASGSSASGGASGSSAAVKTPPVAPAAGSIAAAAPPAAAVPVAAAPTPAAATGPAAIASATASLDADDSTGLDGPFDAAFSEDEVDNTDVEQPRRRRRSSGGEPIAASDAAISGSRSGLAVPPDTAAVPVGGGEGGGGGVPDASSCALLGTSASGSVSGSELLLGTSPGTSKLLNTPGVQGEFYTYQAVDGSWVFLHPLNLRCLLHHYGSYESCPPVLTGRLLELEDEVQGEATRRRWRFLSHLPLGGAFRLCELALGDLLPPEALTTFSDELAARDKRRRRQRADDRRQAAAEASAAARAAAARVGPSAAELQAMPSLGSASGGGGGGGSGLAVAAGAAAAALARMMQLSAEEVEESIALQTSLEEAAAAAAAGGSGGGGAGVSFARITKMGYAATGPALGSSPPPLLSGGTPAGVWSARATGSGGTSGGSGAAAAGNGGAAGLLSPSSPWSGIGGSVTAAAPAASAAGVWGSGKGMSAFKGAAATTAAGGAKGDGGDGAGTPGGSKKNKSGKGTLLFSTGAPQRKY